MFTSYSPLKSTLASTTPPKLCSAGHYFHVTKVNGHFLVLLLLRLFLTIDPLGHTHLLEALSDLTSLTVYSLGFPPVSLSKPHFFPGSSTSAHLLTIGFLQGSALGFLLSDALSKAEISTHVLATSALFISIQNLPPKSQTYTLYVSA